MSRRVIYADRSAEFWPSGSLVWLSVALGTLDLSLIVFLIHQVATH